MFMRFWLAVIFLVCVTGFIATSGTLTVQAGEIMVNTSALRHTIPVLIALAAPMVTMAFVLLVTMTLGRPTIRHQRRRTNSRS